MATAQLNVQQQASKTSSSSITRFAGNTSKSSSGTGCVIARGTSVEGHLKSSDNIRLDGELKGTIACEKRVVMGESGKVEGSIYARDADISGFVEGDVQTEKLLTLRMGAHINGNIKAGQIYVEEGAIYNGKCSIGG